MNILKKIAIWWVSDDLGHPLSQTADAWVVKWYARYGIYHGDVTEQCAVFTTESEANAFAKKLSDAYDLLRHTSGTNIYVSKMPKPEE